MTELVSAENILKHLSYSNLKVSHFAEHSKGVFLWPIHCRIKVTS